MQCVSLVRKTQLRNLALIAAILALSALHAEELVPGLIGEYFNMKEPISGFLPTPVTIKPTFVRVEKNVDFGEVTGDFYGIKFSDNFHARWSGTLRVEKEGDYTITATSDDGSRVFIDGKAIVENPGMHPMTEKSGTVKLSAGDHDLRIEYYQGGGGAGCRVSWKSGGKDEAIPAKALFHKKEAENVAWDKAAWEKMPKGAAGSGGVAGKYEKTDYGSFQSGTIVSGPNQSNKGIAIKLGKIEKPADEPTAQGIPQAAVAFDTEMLRVQAGWNNGFVKLPRGRDGIEGQPAVNGTVLFSTKKGNPGWARGDDFKDPRNPKMAYGNLPADWARYKGLYLHGNKVVLKYTVGDCTIHEQPGVEVLDGVTVITRTLNLGTSSKPLTMLLCEDDKSVSSIRALESEAGATNDAGRDVCILAAKDATTGVIAGISGAPAGTKWEAAEGGRIHLKLPVLTQPVNIKVILANQPIAERSKLAPIIAAKPESLDAYLKGGPPRWTDVVTTQGILGDSEEGLKMQGVKKGEVAAGGGAYVVDTLAVPYDNPYQSYMRLTGMDFFPDGRIAVCTMDGDVWIVSGVDEKLEKLTWKRFATGLFQSLGLRIVDGKIYCTCRDQLVRLHDLNNDGEADFYEAFNNECMVSPNYHEFALDLHTDKAGNFYYMKGSTLGANTDHNGNMIRVSKDGSKFEIFSTGYRAPNGMCVGPDDQITTGDNQGNWTPSCPINWVTQGSFSGYLDCHHRDVKPDKRPPPIVWMPMHADNSSGGQVWVKSDKWGPFNGHLLHLSYGKCALFHVMFEEIDGIKQGGVTRFPLSFASGTMRARFSALDGQLYICGMKGWQTEAARDGCLQRVRYTGKPVHMPTEFHVTKTGMDITFASPLDPKSAADVDNYSAQWFNVVWTKDYGSPEFNVSDPKKKGREELKIESVKLSPDGKTVSLIIPGLKPVTNVVIKYKVTAADGTAISQELCNTINVMP